MQSLMPGERAPDFSATTQDGRQISLQDYRGKKAVVLFFYPKDNTAICTQEACSFRDAYEQFVEAGAVVIGVSSDSIKSHQGFAAAHRLPFLLAADEDGALRKAFRVPNSLLFLPGRTTFVIDRNGIVQHVFNSQFLPQKHVEEALRIVRELNAGGDSGE